MNFEQMLITASIYHPGVFSKISFLEPDDFKHGAHSDIWEKMKEIQKEGSLLDISILHDKLRGIGDMQNYINILYSDVLVSKGFNYLAYARKLREESVLASLANNPDIEKVREKIAELERCKNETVKEYSFSEAIHRLMGSLEHPNTDVIDLGFSRLDRIVGGLNKGDLVVLSARPAMGKTTWALWVAYQTAKKGRRVLFFNLEMSVENLMKKIISAETRIDNACFRDSNFKDTQLSVVVKKMADLVELSPKLTIADAGAITVEEIEEKMKMGVDFVVIDQLTKIRPSVKRDRKDLEIADITFSLKELAKKYQVPILLLHQTNRLVDRRTDQMPTLSDLRDSGAVEQDADVVMFLHRKAYYDNSEDDNRMIVKVAKNKMGMTGVIGFLFLRETSTIEEVSKDYEKLNFSDYMKGA